PEKVIFINRHLDTFGEPRRPDLNLALRDEWPNDESFAVVCKYEIPIVSAGRIEWFGSILLIRLEEMGRIIVLCGYRAHIRLLDVKLRGTGMQLFELLGFNSLCGIVKRG